MTEIPFAHVLLRNKAGDLSGRGDGAYVPLKYCHEITKEEADICKAGRKEMMKRQRALSKATEAEIARRVADANGDKS